MMTKPQLSARTLAGVVAIAALAAALVLPEAGAAAPPQACGLTTLEGTVRATSSGVLRCGPGDPIQVRDDLVKPDAARAETRQPMLAFLALGDMHITDEESPLRAEGVDSCLSEDFERSYRPHEALLPHLANAHVRAAAALASKGSPRLNKAYDFAVQLGDAADNKQLNETRWAIDLLDGGLVDPDSGAEGYEGSQTRDPKGGSSFTSPVGDRSIRELANEPFFAGGLRTTTGIPLPWYAVIGSHDAKVQGTLADTEQSREAANAIATGQVKMSSLSPAQRHRLCQDPSLATDPAFLQELAADAAGTRSPVVSADPDRKVITREEWAQQHTNTKGLPIGHGLASGRCTDAQGKTLPRLCYSWDHGPFHMVALDTAPPEAGEDGNIDAEQFAWLERDLKATSSTYFDADGDRKRSAATDRLVVVFSHHSDGTMTNGEDDEAHDGEALEQLLLRFPNVVLHVSASTHRDKVVAHRDTKTDTAYWQINAGSISDWPTRSRSIEIADNHDGTLSIFGLQFEAAAATNARAVSWRQDDTTAERSMGSATNVNEDWLAAAAREIALNDPQAPSGSSSVKHRNVELLLKHPLGVTPRTGTVPFPRQFPSFTPGLPGGFQFPNLPPGFPGGIDQNFPQNPFEKYTGPPPTTFRFPGQPTEFLPIKPTSGNALVPRIALLMVAAAAGAYWLLQARVRRWMIGI